MKRPTKTLRHSDLRIEDWRKTPPRAFTDNEREAIERALNPRQGPAEAARVAGGGCSDGRSENRG